MAFFENADNLAVYITTRNHRVVARALQGITNKLDSWAAERGPTFSISKTVNSNATYSYILI